MSNKNNVDHMLNLVDKIERSVMDLEQRCQSKLYQPTGLLAEVRKHKAEIHRIYGRKDG